MFSYFSTRTAVLLQTSWTPLLLVNAWQGPNQSHLYCVFLDVRDCLRLVLFMTVPCACSSWTTFYCLLDPWETPHIFTMPNREYSRLFQVSLSCQFSPVLFLTGQIGEGHTAINLCLKYFLLLPKNGKTNQSLTGVLLALPSLWLAGGQG